MRRRILSVVCVATLLAGFAGAAEMTPDQKAAAQTLQAMFKLAQSGDWGEYVDRYYGETHKFGSDADRDALVRRFEERWGEKVVDGLERVVGSVPEISEGKAIFNVEGKPGFVLHRAPDGSWKFHL